MLRFAQATRKIGRGAAVSTLTAVSVWALGATAALAEDGSKASGVAGLGNLLSNTAAAQQQPSADAARLAELGRRCVPDLGQEYSEERSAQGTTTGADVVEAYNAANEAYEAGNVDEAIRIIREVLRKDDLTDAEKAVLWRYLANLELEKENYAEAIRLLERVLGLGIFQGSQQAEMYYFLGGLYLASEQTDKAIETLRRFFRQVNNPPPASYYLLAQAYAVKENWQRALPCIEAAIAKYESLEANAGQRNETYYRLMVAALIQLREWRRAVPLLENMVVWFQGKDEYWAMLAAGYQELGREEDVYAVQELRYIQGFLDSSRDIVSLAELHMFYGYPYKAARLLESEIERGRVEKTAENYEKLGNAWLASREYRKAREALLEAARLSDERSGKLYFQIAMTYAQEEDWPNTERFLRRALDSREGMSRSDVGTAYLLLGHSLNNNGKRAAALRAFREAAKYDNVKDDAETWIKFLEELIAIELRKNRKEILDSVIELTSPARDGVERAELALGVAQQALETANRARTAETERSRNVALDEYRIRREEAVRQLQGQREEATAARDAAMEVIERARQLEGLERSQADAVDALEQLVNRRLELIERAEQILEQAATIISDIEAGNVPLGSDPVGVPTDSGETTEGGEEEPAPQTGGEESSPQDTEQE